MMSLKKAAARALGIPAAVAISAGLMVSGTLPATASPTNLSTSKAGVDCSTAGAVMPEACASITMVVEDYTTDGKLVDTHTVEIPLTSESLRTPGIVAGETSDGGMVAAGTPGNYTMPAPAASSGCRSAYDVANGSPYYRMKHTVEWCYNKSTRKVTSPRATQAVLDDGTSPYTDVSVYGTWQKNYYTYHSGVSNSGWRSLLQWKATYQLMTPVNYYPSINIFAHGNGSAYFSWNGDAAR